MFCWLDMNAEWVDAPFFIKYKVGKSGIGSTT